MGRIGVAGLISGGSLTFLIHLQFNPGGSIVSSQPLYGLFTR